MRDIREGDVGLGLLLSSFFILVFAASGQCPSFLTELGITFLTIGYLLIRLNT